jgi:hypothetical protein
MAVRGFVGDEFIKEIVEVLFKVAVGVIQVDGGRGMARVYKRHALLYAAFEKDGLNLVGNTASTWSVIFISSVFFVVLSLMALVKTFIEPP